MIKSNSQNKKRQENKLLFLPKYFEEINDENKMPTKSV